MVRKVLLIDDDRMQFRLAAAHFKQFRLENFELEWAATYEEGLQKLLEGSFAACLLDYQLGARDGLALIREATAAGCRVPIVFLTAETGENVDVEAMNAGALDYLIKGEITTRSLERSLRYASKLGDTLEALRKLATRDELTGLLNRREFERLVADEEERARRFGRTFGLILVDLDHFKRINDTHGHPAGDAVLRLAAQRLSMQLRSVDRIARYGGEEFVVMVTEVNGRVAGEVARRLVDAMNASPFSLPDGLELKVTASAGSAATPEDGVDLKTLVAAADKALYTAKAQGRNRAVMA
jgi:two-component system, cell cycle response regulator